MDMFLLLRKRLLDNHVAIKFYYWGGDELRHFEPKAFLRSESTNILKIYDAGSVDETGHIL